MSKIYSDCKTNKLKRYLGLALTAACLTLPLQTANCNVLPDADGKDDSEVIVQRIRESLSNTGMVSIEQHTGRLLFNPIVDRLHNMALKQKFFMPAMVINQKTGLKMVGELPLSCFMVSAGELASDGYKGYRQHDTLHYIRAVKDFPVSRALICQTVGASSKQWKQNLSLSEDIEQFVFEEHVSLSGEHFYYFVNADGSFEMYM